MHRDDKTASGWAPDLARAGWDGRAGVSARVRGTALALLIAHLTVVSWLVLRPVPATWVEPPNLRLSATIQAELAEGPATALPTLGSWLLVLAPLGVLLPMTGRWLGGTRFASFTRTVFAGLMIALAHELLRSTNPSQVADVDQVLLATLGVAVTHLCAYGWLRRLLPRADEPASPVSRLGQEPIPQGAPLRRDRVAVRPRTDAWMGSLSVR